MLIIRDDFTRLNAVYLMRSRDEAIEYFGQYLVDCRFTSVSSLVETVDTDDAAEFMGAAFVYLYRERCIRQSTPLQTIRIAE